MKNVSFLQSTWNLVLIGIGFFLSPHYKVNRDGSVSKFFGEGIAGFVINSHGKINFN